MKNLILLIVFVSIATCVYSQSNVDVRVNQILDSRGEIVFAFKASPDEIGDFVKILSVDHYNGKDVIAYANRSEFDKFLSSGKEFQICEDYYSEKSLSMATTVAEMLNWDRYPTYEVYIEMMQAFAQDFPEICKLDTIGASFEGRQLLVVKISDNVNVDETEPEFLYTGMMHGDELVTGMMFLRLIDYMLAQYGTDTQITNLIDNVQIYINPFANPDGTYAGGNSTVADATRSNGQEIDLNRNFPDFIEGQNPDGNSTAVETQLMIDFAASRNFVMSANSHSGAELLNYPYDTESIYPADNDWWLMVCNDYADLAHSNSPAGYLTDQDGGVTNGYAWYRATGTRQDYMNYYEYCREVTLELSAAKLLDSEELPDHWNYNKDAMLSYLEHVTYGIKGIVTDSITGEPLEAKVYIEGHDMINSHVFSFPTYGDYYRLIHEGNYTVTYSCDGYRSKTKSVSVTNYLATVQDVQLVNLEILPPSVNFNSQSQISDCNPAIQFENTSETTPETTYLWDFGDGSNSTEENPLHVYHSNGNYSVKLKAENSNGQDSLIKEEYIFINLSTLYQISDYAICETSGSVTIDTELAGEVHWYNNIDEETSFHVGASYTTPELSESEIYYVQETVFGDEYNGGEPDDSESGDYVNSHNYLLFDCTEECILETVKVYANEAGTRTIYLKDSNGGVLYNEDFVIGNGEQIVELNYVIPEGTAYKIGCTNPQGLLRGSVGMMSSFSYPYNIGDVISINESNVVWWNDGHSYYAYFYDWHIRLPDCVSERTEVNVFVNETTVADFETSVNGSVVSFNNTSIGADTYSWEFGDESSASSDTNPVHTYNSGGTYTVVLTAESECGSDEVTHNVIVTTDIDDFVTLGLTVYPNPVKDNLFVSSDSEITQLILTDISGKIIHEFDNISSDTFELNITNLQSGVYLLRISTKDANKLIKLIKN